MGSPTLLSRNHLLYATHPCHAAALVVKQQEQQEWQLKVDSIDAGDLPRYIEASAITLGTLLVCCGCGSSGGQLNVGSVSAADLPQCIEAS